jgi:hypothetical protein
MKALDRVRSGAKMSHLIVVAAGRVAACGRSSPKSTSVASTTPAYVACVAENGYELPAPNTSGKGAVFPAPTQHDSQYRMAAKNCVSILQLRVDGRADSG